MSKPLWQWSATKTARAIRKGKVSALEVTQAHVARMHAVNPTLNAVVYDLSDDALRAAKAADKAQRNGVDIGPLHGVPVTIKENVDIQGRPNPNGVPALESVIAPADSPLVRNFRNAGAIILGQTNAPEFSMRAFTDNPLHGLTLNPWDHAITCGGSSGGAASAVAAGIGTIAHGNDIGGSLRIPAHCCGVATIKPTQGRIPAFNPSATAERPMLASLMSCQGPIARTVADVRLGLEVMSRRDPRDPWWVPAPLKGPKPRKPIKVAMARIPDDMPVHPSVRDALRTAADALERAGYRVTDMEVPDITGVWHTWSDVLNTEMHVMSAEAMLAMGSEDFRKVFTNALRFTEIKDQRGYMEAYTRRSTHIRNWMMFLEDQPIILAPTYVQPTPGPRADLESPERLHQLFFNEMRFIAAVNVLGLPAAVVPVALHEGHPIGVQLIASRYREDLALDAAHTIEDEAGVLVKQMWGREKA